MTILLIILIILSSFIVFVLYQDNKIVYEARKERDEARLELSHARKSYEERIARLKGRK